MRLAAIPALGVLAGMLAGPGFAAPPTPTPSPSTSVTASTAGLRVGMETRQQPWSWVPGQGLGQEDLRKTPVVTAAQSKRLVGIDVDVMAALEKRLEVPLRLVPTSWFDLEPGLLAGRYDLILSSWTPSPRTPAEIAPTDPYYEWGLVVAVRANDTRIRSYQDLEGKRVGHYNDPSVERSLRSLAHGQLEASDDADALFARLAASALDAVIFDSPYVRWKAAHDARFRVAGEPLNRLGYHVGVRRAESALFERVQAAVKAIVASGEVAAIRKRWESAEAPR